MTSIAGRLGRWLVSLCGGLLTVSLVGACAGASDGLAIPNEQDVREYQVTRFNEALENLRAYFREDRDVKGTTYWLATFEGKKSQREVDTVRMGSPPAFLSRSRSGIEGDNIDTYHPAGSDRDYVLLGKRYRHLAPTPWVAHPTFYPKQGYTICVMPGIGTGCKLLEAASRTQRENPKGLVVKYTRHEDGRVELLTGVTLKAFLDARVLTFPPELRTKMDDTMLKQLIPFRIKFDADGALDMFEMNGEVEGGPSPLKIQVGFDVTGPASREDFPPPPSGFDVTVLPDKKATDAFYDKLGQI